MSKFQDKLTALRDRDRALADAANAKNALERAQAQQRVMDAENRLESLSDADEAD
jgi:hypothetical protein